MKKIIALPTEDKRSNILLCIKSYYIEVGNSDLKGNFRLGVGLKCDTEYYKHHHLYKVKKYGKELREGDYVIHDDLGLGCIINDITLKLWYRSISGKLTKITSINLPKLRKVTKSTDSRLTNIPQISETKIKEWTTKTALEQGRKQK